MTGVQTCALPIFSTKAANDTREGKPNSLITELAGDPRIPLDYQALEKLLASPLEFAGLAQEQCDLVIAKIHAVTKSHPDAATYQPSQIR